MRDLLVSRSMLDAAAAYSCCAAVPDGSLVMLANLREIIAEIPETPFLTGQPIEVLELVAGYERCVNSYRRLFEGEGGVSHSSSSAREPSARRSSSRSGRPLQSGRRHGVMIDPEVLDLALEHRTLIDEILRALQALGVALDPRVYVTPDDFTAENAAGAAGEMFRGLF